MDPFLRVLPLCHLCESKVSDLKALILDENIGRLKVSVHDAFRQEEPITVDDLLSDFHHLLFGEPNLLFESLLKRLGAQLQKQIDVVSGLPHIEQAYYVLVLELLHYVNLVLQGCQKFLGIFLQFLAGDLLDGAHLVGCYICSRPDYPKRALSQPLVQADDVGVYKLVVGTAQLLGLLFDFVVLVGFLFIHGYI